jgi:hypothetical protein
MHAESATGAGPTAGDLEGENVDRGAEAELSRAVGSGPWCRRALGGGRKGASSAAGTRQQPLERVQQNLAARDGRRVYTDLARGKMEIPGNSTNADPGEKVREALGES